MIGGNECGMLSKEYIIKCGFSYIGNFSFFR